MRKVVLCGMLLGLLTGMCFAQRGMGRPMGVAGNARIGPAAARPFPNVTGIGSNVGHPGAVGIGTPAKTVPSNVGIGTNPKSISPDSVRSIEPDGAVGSNPKSIRPDATVGADPRSIRPDATLGTNPKSISPDAAVGDNPSGIAPDASGSRDAGLTPQ